MKQTAHDLLGEETTKTPKTKEIKPAAKAAAEEKTPTIKLPKLGDLVLFRKAENDEIVEHLAMVLSVPTAKGSTALDLNVHKPGYIDFAKKIPFSEEKQPHTWGFLDSK